jgi:hypothetical protein
MLNLPEPAPAPAPSNAEGLPLPLIVLPTPLLLPIESVGTSRPVSFVVYKTRMSEGDLPILLLFPNESKPPSASPGTGAAATDIARVATRAVKKVKRICLSGCVKLRGFMF